MRAAHTERPHAHLHRVPGDWNGGESDGVVEAVGGRLGSTRVRRPRCLCDVAPLLGDECESSKRQLEDTPEDQRVKIVGQDGAVCERFRKG